MRAVASAVSLAALAGGAAGSVSGDGRRSTGRTRTEAPSAASAISPTRAGLGRSRRSRRKAMATASPCATTGLAMAKIPAKSAASAAGTSTGATESGRTTRATKPPRPRPRTKRGHAGAERGETGEGAPGHRGDGDRPASPRRCEGEDAAEEEGEGQRPGIVSEPRAGDRHQELERRGARPRFARASADPQRGEQAQAEEGAAVAAQAASPPPGVAADGDQRDGEELAPAKRGEACRRFAGVQGIAGIGRYGAPSVGTVDAESSAGRDMVGRRATAPRASTVHPRFATVQRRRRRSSRAAWRDTSAEPPPRRWAT